MLIRCAQVKMVLIILISDVRCVKCTLKSLTAMKAYCQTSIDSKRSKQDTDLSFCHLHNPEVGPHFVRHFLRRESVEVSPRRFLYHSGSDLM